MNPQDALPVRQELVAWTRDWLGEVALQNADGQYLTTLTADISAAGTLALAAGNVFPSIGTQSLAQIIVVTL